MECVPNIVCTVIFETENKDIVYSGLGVIAIVILAQKFLTNKMTNGTIYATIILVALWCGYL